MTRRIDGSVVVVTGATSGVGRAAAVAFARRGARLVLAARGAAALDDVAVECLALGARAVTHPTDIGSADALDSLVGRAVAEFGHIDTWVDTAAVLLAGPITATPPEEIERLVKTNVLGSALVCRAALARFEAQGHGVLIATSSVLAVVPNPVVPIYTMSKFGIRGLLLGLNASYRDHRRIHICEVMPGPMDTPMFAHAGNHTGRLLRAIPPACAPERAAAAIVRSAARPRRRRVVGLTGRFVLLGTRIVPRFTQWAVARYSGRMILTGSEQEPTTGGLFDPPPSSDRSMSGDWRLGRARRAIGAAVGRAAAGAR